MVDAAFLLPEPRVIRPAVSPRHHHHVKDSALVPAAQPAYAPAIDVDAERNGFAQAKEFRLDLRAFLHSAT